MIENIKLWWALTFNLSHFAGKISVVALFLCSGATVTHLIARSLGHKEFLSAYYANVSSIYAEPVAWAATSMLIATTVAMGHMRNLQINEEKYQNELHEKWKKEYEERKNKPQKPIKGFEI